MDNTFNNFQTETSEPGKGEEALWTTIFLVIFCLVFLLVNIPDKLRPSLSICSRRQSQIKTVKSLLYSYFKVNVDQLSDIEEYRFISYIP